ncbi:unnamed protein product [Didymodactylos carnosus]|uniref:Uncharacterized protein n=1 Tax=Didymodactylos carnosus TaxID=1234261 RepID=A0A814MIE4_9BILA|nr:unnamed protein product [Didymodactylos carnosus]CAF1080177.1 unnamed protein product [Didymodactylos carnosus]CAF3712095.1 unnamed protein product [Didymodactylos carnosus]CAF3846221.1 unnamed protein product [Didymodactylos carnosus]
MTTTANYNSDSSTHGLFKQLESQFDQFVSTTDWDPYIEIDDECAQSLLFNKLKEEAKFLAENIAEKAVRQAHTKQRWSHLCNEQTTLAHIIIEILFSRGIRRGSVPTHEKELKLRETLIRNGLTHKDGLKFSILMLPCRDRNKAKNDGYLPDLGEVVALLQLWCIVEAMTIATEKYTQTLIKSFDKVVQPGVQTIIDFRNAVQTILYSKCHSTHAEIKTQRCHIDILRQELFDDYIVLDVDKAELLLHELARINRSIKWFMQSIDETFNATVKSIQIFVVQDGRRYASYDTFLDEHIQAYSNCLNEIAKKLDICNKVILTSHETLEQQWKIEKPRALETFLRKRTEIYSSKFEQLSKPFLQAKNELLKCNTRDSFLDKVRELSLNETIPHMIEPILHSRYHPELAEAQLKPENELKFLAQIYEPQQKNELLRQNVLFSSLINAIKYICSYESNTATKNKYALDDLKFLLPGSVRLSIHNKSSDCEQFLIKIGPNLHRQPWQGTAGIRQSSKCSKYALSFEIRLSFEYKTGNYIPIFISPQQNNGCYCFFSELSRINQPILWIHFDLIQQYLSNVYVNNNDYHKRILSQIFTQSNKIRLINN